MKKKYLVSSWFYYPGKAFVYCFMHAFTSWRVIGKNNVPEKGSLLVVCNHLSMADPPLLATSLGRKVTFMAKEELFHTWWSIPLVKTLGAFPVRRSFGREAMRNAAEILDAGNVLVMFPEGGRSRNFKLQAGHPGAALLALHKCVPILPVAISGTEKIKGLGWMLRRPKVTLNIGETFKLSPVEGKVTREELAQMTGTIMEHIAALLPEAYRGDDGSA